MIISPLKVWVQNILPVVYDDSLSYLEIVAKLNAKTNEIITQTNENTHAIETLAETIAELGDIEELRALLDEVEAIVEDLYTTDVPEMDGTASAGSADHAARSDHVHPSDTSKAPVNHASNENTYGIGDASNYGHVKITDDINNADAGTGVKATVVKGVNDKLRTFSKENLLDNWYFPNCVNQRGQSSYSNANAYTIDRWKLTSGSVTVVSGGITLNGTLVQIRENAVGRPVVCSALLSNGTMITPTYNDTTKTFTLTATGQTIVAVKMELGTEQTLAHNEGTTENPNWVINEIPDYGEQLEKCQRYYFNVGAATGKQIQLFSVTNATGTKIGFICPLPVRMRNSANLNVLFTCTNIRGNGSDYSISPSEQQSPYLLNNAVCGIDFDLANASPMQVLCGIFTRLIISTEL